MRVESRLSWLAVAAGSALCASVAAVGADARWLAALGAAIVHAGRIPASIPYAAAPSHGWVDVPVLGELVFHWLEALGGDRALVAAQAVAVAATLTLLLRDMRAARAADGARALVIVAIPFAAVSALFVVRAQLFSLPLFALLVLLLRGEARSPSRRVWLVVPLVALWSNLHGAVLIGLAVASAYLVLERMRRERWTALSVLVAAWCALFATPALARTGDYYLRVLHGEPAASGFGLWAPLSLYNALDVLFLVVALPLLWFAWRGHPRKWELVSLVLLAVSALHVGRNSIWFVLFVATPAAVGLGMHRARPTRNVVLACAWVVPIVLLATAFVRPSAQTVAGAALRADAVRLAAGAPILADPEDAEQLALDGRRVWIANPIDAFDRGDQRLYLDWLRGSPAGAALLRRHGVVLVRLDSTPQRRLAHNAAFREVGRDAAAVLYARRY
jgi:hypothetical protein